MPCLILWLQEILQLYCALVLASEKKNEGEKEDRDARKFALGGGTVVRKTENQNDT